MGADQARRERRRIDGWPSHMIYMDGETLN